MEERSFLRENSLCFSSNEINDPPGWREFDRFIVQRFSIGEMELSVRENNSAREKLFAATR